MRLSEHSLRLAVSFLLGVMFMALPVAQTASASTTFPIKQSFVTLASTDEYCSYDYMVKLSKLSTSLTLLPYTKTNTYLENSIVITESKLEKVTAIASVKTVLKKVQDNDRNIIEVNTFPSKSQTSHLAFSKLSTTSSPQDSSGLNADTLFALVNKHRTSKNLTEFKKDPRICELATQRATEIQNEIYGPSYMHAGFFARNLPYFATENIIHHSTEQTALNWWLNSPVHRSAIEGNYQYACVACYAYNCSMIFTNFAPKQIETYSNTQ